MIAARADRGGSVARFFTNNGKMMPPVRPGSADRGAPGSENGHIDRERKSGLS